ncbi:MAG: SMI1/KNR4 family protein [Ruminococcaceae bacterium]|nr:SMI1/KNR4 family protein [Oscillospiraceae bacterium]
MEKWGEFEFNEPYVGDEIASICGVALPSNYIEFMKLHNGGEGDIGETWFVLFSLEELQEANDDYEIESYLPGHIIIGSNGSGELYGIDNAGNYFNVPIMIEENYITLLGTDINSLPDRINDLWR